MYISLTKVLIVMFVSFCKKSVDIFISISTIACTILAPPPPPCTCCLHHPAEGGATVPGENPTPNNVVVEPSSLVEPAARYDRVGLGFLDDIGGHVDGWSSCTESLGFESCDDRRVVDKIENVMEWKSPAEGKRRKADERKKKKEVKEFPPPLSSLRSDGRPNFFLRPVRNAGRLELTKVKIHRPEILYATRENGRLRLYLVPEDDRNNFHNVNNGKDYKGKSIVDDKEEEEEEWKLRGSSDDGGEDFRQCHEVVVDHRHHHSHHNHHNHDQDLHGWGQQYVTTR